MTDIKPTKIVVLYNNGPTRKSGKADGKNTNNCITQKTWLMTLELLRVGVQHAEHANEKTRLMWVAPAKAELSSMSA
jgi:hypothetical protein